MSIEKQLEDIRHQLNVIAASMAFRDGLSDDLFCRADALQKISRTKFEKDKIKHEAWQKYMDMKYELTELEKDYPEFKNKPL
jgi:hypothetical protein